MTTTTSIDQQIVAVRPAEPKDCDLLFAWVNRPDSLINKLETSETISYTSHQAWFASRLARPSCTIFIIIVNCHSAGQIRFEDKGEGLEIDVYVLPRYRGLNVATIGLRQAIQSLRQLRVQTVLIARVAKNNHQSLRFFEKMGFQRSETIDKSHKFTQMLSKDQAT